MAKISEASKRAKRRAKELGLLDEGGNISREDMRELEQTKTRAKPKDTRDMKREKRKEPTPPKTVTERQSRSPRRSVRRREPKITHREVDPVTLEDDPALFLASINTRALGRRGPSAPEARREFVETLETISPEERRAIESLDEDDVYTAAPVSLREFKDIGKGELDPLRVEGITVEERLRDPSMEKSLIDI